MEFAAICALLSTKLGDGVLELHEEGVEPWVDMKPDQIAVAAHLLRELPELDFNQLMCLSGIDWDGLDEKGKGKSVAILGYSVDGKPETSDRVGEGDLGVAFLGAGNYATRVLMPAFKKAGARMECVVSTGGVSGVHAARKFGFQRTTTSIEDLMGDEAHHLIQGRQADYMMTLSLL